MNELPTAVAKVLEAQADSGKPLAIILAGHNGSGKSTMWYSRLAPVIRIPLINADRMMLSILPEAGHPTQLPEWARDLRDTNEGWMAVARQSVDSFVVNAMNNQVNFAYETVFSHTEIGENFEVITKAQQLQRMQRAGFFVLLVFVGLANVDLSTLRVLSRKSEGGHDVPQERLTRRFPKTQNAIRGAIPLADASLLVDNSIEPEHAFSLCRVQIGEAVLHDIRSDGGAPAHVSDWLNIVSPLPA